MESVVIQSVIENMTNIEAFIDAVCAENNCNNYFGTISMAVLQAVENAIVHGNNSNPGKKVVVSCSRVKGGIAFTVEDEGKGFDFQKYNDFPMGEDGTGIFMMRTLSDSCTFTNGGRTVCLAFQIQGIEKSEYIERVAALKNFYSVKKINA